MNGEKKTWNIHQTKLTWNRNRFLILHTCLYSYLKWSNSISTFILRQKCLALIVICIGGVKLRLQAKIWSPVTEYFDIQGAKAFICGCEHSTGFCSQWWDQSKTEINMCTSSLKYYQQQIKNILKITLNLFSLDFNTFFYT